MTTSVTLDGVTFTDTMFAGYGYLTPVTVNGTNYPAWQGLFVAGQTDQQTAVTNATNQATAAAASATAAAASANTATMSVNTQATSTTSLTIALGTQTLSVQTGKGFASGMPVRLAKNDGSLNFMDGVVTSYNSGTGTMVVNVTQITGSGTFAAWNVFLEGPLPSVNINGSGTVASGASSIVLTSTSARAQNVTFTTQGQSVTLPDATTCNLGGPVFSISNAGQYAFAVRRNDASILTVVSPGGSADLYLDFNGTAKGTWHATGQGLLAGMIYSPVNSLANSTTTQPAAFWQCGNIVVLLGALTANGSLYAQAVDVSQQPCAVGPAVLVSNSFSGGSFINQLAATTIDSTHLLVAFQNSSGVAITGVVLTLSGTTVSVSSASTLATVTASGTISSIITLSTSLAVMLYTNGTNCYTVAIGLSAGAITGSGAPVAMTGPTSYIYSSQQYNNNYPVGTAPLIALSATSFIAIAGSNAANYAQAGSISGTTITLGGALTVNSQLNNAGLLSLGANAFLLVGYSGPSYQSFVALTVSGTTITGGAVYTNSTVNNNTPLAVIAFNSTTVGVVMSGSYAMVLSISGTTVTQAVAPASIYGAAPQNLTIQASQIVTWNGPAATSNTDQMQYSVLTASGVTNYTVRMPLPPGVIPNVVPFVAGSFAFSGSSTQYNASSNAANSAILGYKFNGAALQFIGVISGGQIAGPYKFWPLSATEILVTAGGNYVGQIMEMAS